MVSLVTLTQVKCKPPAQYNIPLELADIHELVGEREKICDMSERSGLSALRVHGHCGY